MSFSPAVQSRRGYRNAAAKKLAIRGQADAGPSPLGEVCESGEKLEQGCSNMALAARSTAGFLFYLMVGEDVDDRSMSLIGRVFNPPGVPG